MAAVLDQLDFQNPNLISTMLIFLQKEFTIDTFVNLEQAGHSVEERTLLARVFVDRPVVKGNHARAVRTPAEKNHNIVKMIIDAGNEKLDPMSAMPAQHEISLGQDSVSQDPGRFVILGGPGQGKTTVGQFVAQLYRFALLEHRPRQNLSRDVQSVLQEIKHQCKKEEISPPRAKRFPIRMALNRFATTAGEGNRRISLLAYMAGHIAARTDRPVSPEHLEDG